VAALIGVSMLDPSIAIAAGITPGSAPPREFRIIGRR
jgi:hypothetical protein